MPNPICDLCNKPVKLETSKTDERGKAVHEGCYLLKVKRDVFLVYRRLVLHSRPEILRNRAAGRRFRRTFEAEVEATCKRLTLQIDVTGKNLYQVE